MLDLAVELRHPQTMKLRSDLRAHLAHGEGTKAGVLGVEPRRLFVSQIESGLRLLGTFHAVDRPQLAAAVLARDLLQLVVGCAGIQEVGTDSGVEMEAVQLEP